MGERVEGEIEVAEPVAAPEDDFPARVESALADLDSRLGESQRLLTRQTELAEKLHAENQSLRAGELQSAQLPLVRDLIRLSDDLERMRAVAGEAGEDLKLVHESLLDLLARNGIQIFGAEQGEPFDTQLHTAAGVESTEQEELDKTVGEVVRPGFRWESGEVIRVAEVRAYRFGGSG